MNLLEVRLNIINKKAEAVQAFINTNSEQATEYRHRQGIIQGIDICLGLIDVALKEDDDA